MKKTVVLGFLGTTLDKSTRHAKRWEVWRPTVALCQQEDLVIDRLELFHGRSYSTLCDVIRGDVERTSPETVVVPRLMELNDAWDFEEVYSSLLDFSLAYPWDTEKERYLLHLTTGTHVGQICMFLLAEARYLPAELIQTSPSSSQERSARGTYRIIDLDLSKYDRIASRFQTERNDDLSFLKSGIETRNAKFNALIEQIERVALSSREPMLLLGPTGAGKSRLARRIYELKRARNQLTGSFVDVNCATLRGDGAMSTLFGHVRGAFTGAAQSRDGLLRGADGGILFLDEVGELGLDEQAMLLRALEDKAFMPVGSDREVRSDFQLIAGTNRDLKRQARDGRFREDLLARIDLWSFDLPPLRERREDVAPNLEYELERFAARYNKRVSFNKEARDRFLRFAHSPEALWSANFRDLSAAITRMATLADGGRITEELVEEEITRLSAAWSTSHTSHPSRDEEEVCRRFGVNRDDLGRLDRFERVQLLDVLEVCSAARSLSEAGRELFGSRDHPSYNHADRLRKYLLRFGIRWKERERRER